MIIIYSSNQKSSWDCKYFICCRLCLKNKTWRNSSKTFCRVAFNCRQSTYYYILYAHYYINVPSIILVPTSWEINLFFTFFKIPQIKPEIFANIFLTQLLIFSYYSIPKWYFYFVNEFSQVLIEENSLDDAVNYLTVATTTAQSINDVSTQVRIINAYYMQT